MSQSKGMAVWTSYYWAKLQATSPNTNHMRAAIEGKFYHINTTISRGWVTLSWLPFCKIVPSRTFFRRNRITIVDPIFFKARFQLFLCLEKPKWFKIAYARHQLCTYISVTHVAGATAHQLVSCGWQAGKSSTARVFEGGEEAGSRPVSCEAGFAG